MIVFESHLIIHINIFIQKNWLIKFWKVFIFLKVKSNSKTIYLDCPDDFLLKYIFYDNFKLFYEYINTIKKSIFESFWIYSVNWMVFEKQRYIQISLKCFLKIYFYEKILIKVYFHSKELYILRKISRIKCFIKEIGCYI